MGGDPGMKAPAPLYLRLVRRLSRRWESWRVALLRHDLKSCGAGVSVNWPVTIHGADHVSLGARVSINSYVHIWGQGGVEIGDDTLIASHVAITSLTHVPGAVPHSASHEARPVKIGQNVWIGAHAVILPGVTIGDDAVVGAGAVVTRDVPAGAKVVGVPARPLPPRPDHR